MFAYTGKLRLDTFSRRKSPRTSVRSRFLAARGFLPRRKQRAFTVSRPSSLSVDRFSTTSAVFFLLFFFFCQEFLLGAKKDCYRAPWFANTSGEMGAWIVPVSFLIQIIALEFFFFLCVCARIGEGPSQYRDESVPPHG